MPVSWRTTKMPRGFSKAQVIARFFVRAFEMPRIETKAFVTLPIDDAAIHWSAVSVHIEDGKKNPNTPRACIEHFGFVDLDNVRDGPISRSQNRIGVRRRNSFRIAEKRNRVNEETAKSAEEARAK